MVIEKQGFFSKCDTNFRTLDLPHASQCLKSQYPTNGKKR